MYQSSRTKTQSVGTSDCTELRLSGDRENSDVKARTRGGFKLVAGRSSGPRPGGDTACGPCIRANNLPPLAGAGRHNGTLDPSKNARGRTRRRAPRQRTIVLRRGRRRLRCRSKRGEEGRWSRRGRVTRPVRVRRARAGTRRGGARRCEASPAVRRRTLGAVQRRNKVGSIRAGESSRVASGVGAAIRRRIDPRSGHRSAMPRQP